jgi:hypothetical protein
LRIVGRAASAVVSGAVLDTIAVDIHIDKVTSLSLEVNDAVVIFMITTIPIVYD